MKYIMMFSIVVSSLSLNAMDAPNVTQWQKICENPEKKEQLVTVYRNFCKKRFERESMGTFGSWSLFGLLIAGGRAIPECALGVAVLAMPTMIFALCRTACLTHASDRYNLAEQGNLTYLNHDVLMQLGNPRVYDGSSVFVVEDFKERNSYSKHGSKYSRDFIRTNKFLAVDNVEGIQEALSGKKVIEESKV
jgi:hypothetical protein